MGSRAEAAGNVTDPVTKLNEQLDIRNRSVRTATDAGR
jgi:hypothetical protein